MVEYLIVKGSYVVSYACLLARSLVGWVPAWLAAAPLCWGSALQQLQNRSQQDSSQPRGYHFPEASVLHGLAQGRSHCRVQDGQV